jgi:hypothetical protein
MARDGVGEDTGIADSQVGEAIDLEVRVDHSAFIFGSCDD